MHAQDVMTRAVVTAAPGAAINELAELMVKNRISSVPIVVDDQRIVGIVTESDLIRRAETETERKRNWWVELFVDPDTKAREFVKSHGLTAKDIMSRVVITVSETATLGDVAAILDTHKFRRVPVVRDGSLVGIVSRSDLVRALAQVVSKREAPQVDNDALHKAVYDALRKHQWINSLYMTFTVEKGAVTLIGFVDSDDQRRALKVLVEEIPGVREVHDRLRPRNWHMAA